MARSKSQSGSPHPRSTPTLGRAVAGHPCCHRPVARAACSETSFWAVLQDEDTLNSPAKREVARQEAERLKKQAQQKREMLEKMRMDQNRAGEAGEVREGLWHVHMELLHPFPSYPATK